MHKLVLLLSLISCLFFTTDCYCSDYKENKIISYVAATPRSKEDRISSLVEYLVKPFDDDYDKAKAIAFWIAAHINYDTYLYNNGKTTKLFNAYQGQNPKDLLKSRVGICGDFAELFSTMCIKAGIKSRIIYGYAYPADNKPRGNELANYGHAWNQFLYKNEIINVDTTFMSRGKTQLSGRATNLRHRRALKEVRRENKYNSQMNNFDSFYFDFNYRTEARERGYKHSEL